MKPYRSIFAHVSYQFCGHVLELMFDNATKSILSHPLATICAVGLIVFGIHLTTVADYPAGWFDEIEIIEMGRFSIFSPFPDWSVNLLPGTDGTLHPSAPLFHYLSGFLQESLYRLTGSFVPGRIFFLFSLPVAAILLFVWLRAKAIPASAALPTAILLLLDPNATICAHWYRPDLWTTSLAFASMILLSATGGNTTWRRPAVRPMSPRQVLRDAAIFTCGALFAASSLLIPLYPHIPAIIDQYAPRNIVFSPEVSANLLDRIDAIVVSKAAKPQLENPQMNAETFNRVQRDFYAAPMR